MRYIDGKVETDNVNKIALDLEYTFVWRVFQGKDCISCLRILHKKDNSRTASSITYLFSAPKSVTQTCHVVLISGSVEGSTMVRPFSETSCLVFRIDMRHRPFGTIFIKIPKVVKPRNIFAKIKNKETICESIS